MQRRDLENRIHSVEKLEGIISAMRSMAALRVQQTAKPVEGARSYVRLVSAALTETARLAGEIAAPRALMPRTARMTIVFCSEHGFVGGFNQILLKKADGASKTGARIGIIGSRGALLAREYGLQPAWQIAMASDQASVQEICRQIAGRLFESVANGLASAGLIYAQHGATPGIEVISRALFPIDPNALENASAANPPLLNMPPRELLARLTEEYLMASLTCAAMESLHAENRARLLAMDQAHQGIVRKHDEFMLKIFQMRQEEITTELLDVMTGFEAQTEA